MFSRHVGDISTALEIARTESQLLRHHRRVGREIVIGVVRRGH